MTTTTTKKPTIITQHDYISINFGNNRRLTTSWSGQKASGAVPGHVFNEFCRRILEEANTNFGDRIQKFVDEIDTIWPEWNVPPKTFTVGEEVTYYFGKRKGVEKGVVTKVRGTNVTVRFESSGLISMAADLLQDGNL